MSLNPGIACCVRQPPLPQGKSTLAQLKVNTLLTRSPVYAAWTAQLPSRRRTPALKWYAFGGRRSLGSSFTWRAFACVPTAARIWADVSFREAGFQAARLGLFESAGNRLKLMR